MKVTETRCHYVCENKTVLGYCKTSTCINPYYRSKWDWNFTPEILPHQCQNCLNNPKNGGSGICHCVLGTKTIY